MISRLILFVACISAVCTAVLCGTCPTTVKTGFGTVKTCVFSEDANKGCAAEYVAYIKEVKSPKNPFDITMFNWDTLKACDALLKVIDGDLLEVIGGQIEAKTITALAFPPTEDLKKSINANVASYLKKAGALKKIMTNKIAAETELTWETERLSPLYDNTMSAEFKKDINEQAVLGTGEIGTVYRQSLRLHAAGKMLDKGYKIVDEKIIKMKSTGEKDEKLEETIDTVIDTKTNAFGVTSYPPGGSVGLYIGIAIGVILLIVIIIIVIVVIRRRRSQM